MKDDLVERVAEGIWQAEWARAGNGGRRRVPWSEVAGVDQDRYRFVADAVLAIARPAILEEAARIGHKAAWDADRSGAAIAEAVYEAIRALAHITEQEG